MAGAEAIALGLEPDRARVEWAPEGLRALARAGDASQARAWRLEGEPDWDAIESLRLVSAAFEDGRLLALVAAQPAGAEGHGEARVRAALVEPEGEVIELAEATLSVQYDARGAPSRIGLELYADPEAVPLRVAADREDESGESAGGGESTAMRFRMEGARGSGLFELVSRS
jgi:hypothetical protein